MFAGIITEIAMLIVASGFLIAVVAVAFAMFHRDLRTISLDAHGAKIAAEFAHDVAKQVNHAVNGIDPSEPVLRERVEHVERIVEGLVVDLRHTRDDVHDRLDLLAMALVGKRVLDIGPEDTGEHSVVK